MFLATAVTAVLQPMKQRIYSSRKDPKVGGGVYVSDISRNDLGDQKKVTDGSWFSGSLQVNQPLKSIIYLENIGSYHFFKATGKRWF